MGLAYDSIHTLHMPLMLAIVPTAYPELSFWSLLPIIRVATFLTATGFYWLVEAPSMALGRRPNPLWHDCFRPVANWS